MNVSEIVVLGLAAGALASLVRVSARWMAPDFIPGRWVTSKPLDCATCMGGWVTLAVCFAVGVYRNPEALLASATFVATGLHFGLRWLAASAVAMVVNAYVVPPLDPDTVVVE